jgi:hypothetical protein
MLVNPNGRGVLREKSKSLGMFASARPGQYMNADLHRLTVDASKLTLCSICKDNSLATPAITCGRNRTSANWDPNILTKHGYQ